MTGLENFKYNLRFNYFSKLGHRSKIIQSGKVKNKLGLWFKINIIIIIQITIFTKHDPAKLFWLYDETLCYTFQLI